VDVTGWKIVAQFTDGSSCTIALSNIVLPKKQVLVAQKDALPDAEHAARFDCDTPPDVQLAGLDIYDHDVVVESIQVPVSVTQLWQRKGLTATYRTGDFSKDFVAFSSVRVLADDAWYQLPMAPTLAVSEVLVNPRGCVPSDLTPDCYDYVKVRNAGDEPIDLGLYRLRSGFANVSASASNTTQLTGLLMPGETTRIDHDASGTPVNITANDGTVWLEDAYGLATFDLGVSPYVGSVLVSHKGQSWAFDPSDSTWKWAVPAPGSAENDFSQSDIDTIESPAQTSTLKPCADNQYRSPDTNRCRLIETVAASAVLTPCRADQFRAPDTNRCRSLTSTTGTLTPCKPGQERNPDTNRCRSLASLASATLTPCAANQERNPDTNRCRRVQTTTTSADFAVEPIKQGAKSFAGWWALGGLTTLGAGYGTWEWREEIARLMRRLSLNFPTKH
ncbi:MAG TPA: hypothetical protein VFQ70_02200, partial [Candidatus Saccharimonadaceae bacterium]|nr:hypothetical protein [Candidatus Saccharimonadaceae bacterium]